MFTVEVFSNNVSTGVDFIVSSPFNQPVQKVLSSPSDRQTVVQSPLNRNESISKYAERYSATMASTYSQDNVRAGVDTTLYQTFTCQSPSQVLSSPSVQLLLVVEMEVTLDMPRGVQ